MKYKVRVESFRSKLNNVVVEADDFSIDGCMLVFYIKDGYRKRKQKSGKVTKTSKYRVTKMFNEWQYFEEVNDNYMLEKVGDKIG